MVGAQANLIPETPKKEPRTARGHSAPSYIKKWSIGGFSGPVFQVGNFEIPGFFDLFFLIRI